MEKKNKWNNTQQKVTVMTAKQILLSQQLVWENLLIGCPDILRSLEEVFISGAANSKFLRFPAI